MSPLSSIKPRPIELLAPARDLQTALDAIEHGADAVYIGASRYSARQNAGNSLEDIQKLVIRAHIFSVKVYVTVNTIFFDEELEEVQALIWDLWRIGVDALIIQDMGILEMDLPPIELHASTQMDNRTIEKVDFLEKAGLDLVVLARELSLDEIRAIHEACPKTRLEAFVHGALCVSYSGQCYASQSCYQRSANRGACAQFCRLSFDLEDSQGRKAVVGKHLLSLRDLCQIDHLEEMIDAGVSSFKIEGRLKDSAYVKNVTAAYRQKIDEILSRRPDLRRSSYGESDLTFMPQLDKSFNRGFTNYFLKGRTQDIASIHTPKSVGEKMGQLKSQRGNQITVAGVKPFHNGDGICYFDLGGQLQGLRVNRVTDNHLFLQVPLRTPIPAHADIFRNQDQEFGQKLKGDTAKRRIPLEITLREVPDGLALDFKEKTERSLEVTIREDFTFQEARNYQEDYIRQQLLKLGGTDLKAAREDVHILLQPRFIPASLLTQMRQKATEALKDLQKVSYHTSEVFLEKTSHPFPKKHLTYLGNVLNAKAREFYTRHGVESMEPALEKEPIGQEHLIMTTRHCIRFLLGWCPKRQKPSNAFKEPLYLVSSDGMRFRLAFDCKNCQMQVFSGTKSDQD